MVTYLVTYGDLLLLNNYNFYFLQMHLIPFT